MATRQRYVPKLGYMIIVPLRDPLALAIERAEKRAAKRNAPKPRWWYRAARVRAAERER